MNDFREIIECWPSQRAFADGVGAPLETAKKWHQRNSIPAVWWPAVVAATEDWETPVTLEMLHSLAKQPLREAS